MARPPRRREAEGPAARAVDGRRGRASVGLLRWLRRFKLVRVILNYTDNRGPLLAAGLSFHGIFAAFAALWVGFSVSGLVLEAHPGLRDAVFAFIGQAVPGLIGPGDGAGGGSAAVDRSALLQARVLGWTGSVAFVGLLATAVGWLAACRAAIRIIFELPNPPENVFLLRLKDLALAIGLGVTVLVSAALTVVGTQALGIFQPYLPRGIAGLGTRVLGLSVMFLFDAAVLAIVFRVLSGIRIPARRLLGGASMGAAGLGVLKVVGSGLLGGAIRNPLLASFAIIIGLLVWFNLISQVVLITASWVAVGARDHGVAIWQDDDA